jgi:hypothetical protein
VRDYNLRGQRLAGCRFVDDNEGEDGRGRDEQLNRDVLLLFCYVATVALSLFVSPACVATCRRTPAIFLPLPQ